MGFLGKAADKVRSWSRKDKEYAAREFAKGNTNSGAPASGYDLLQAYGYDVVSDYLRLEHDLLSRFVDYEEMDDYPELMCLAGWSSVFTLEFGWIRIEDLARKECEVHVLSYDRMTKSLVPAKATKVWQNAPEGHSKAMVRVTLDDGRQITCTADHPFLTKDERWVEAGALVSGDRLMPGVLRTRQLSPDSGQYWQVHQPNANSELRASDGKRWMWLHRLVGERLLSAQRGDVVHHEDHNPLNNSPGNLRVMDAAGHAKEHIADLDNSRHLPEWTAERGNHRVVKVEFLTERPAIYDLQVEGYHNFVCEGVVVHNTAIDIYADDATQTDMQLNRSMWLTSKDKDLEQLGNHLLHKTLRVDEDLWEIARVLCISEGSMVWTSSGPKPIEEVKAGDWVHSRGRDGVMKLVRVSKVWCTGERPVFRVSTKHRELEATGNHPVLVQRGDSYEWVNVEDLRYARHPGGALNLAATDKVVCATSTVEPLETPSWYDLGVRIPNSLVGTPNELTLPDKPTVGLMRFLGFMWGDGYTSNADLASTSTTVGFSKGEYEERNALYKAAFESLGLPTFDNHSKTSIEVYSVRLKKMLLDLGWKNGASKKRIPSWIGRLPWELRKSFLDGFIDADGWISHHKTWTVPAISFEIANIPLAEGLKALIDGLGFRSGKLRTRKREPGFKINGKVVKTTQTTATLTYSEVKLDGDFLAEHITGLEPAGVSRVWDIEVDDADHNFVVSGVSVHNCKYGNDYEELLVSEDGVRGLNFLAPPTVRRVEGPNGELYGFVQDFKGRTGYSPAELQQIIASRAAMQQGGAIRDEKVTALEDWEVVHFRLRSKQRRSIYGHSVLEPARWIWKRLMLLEDAALIYRLQRAPERYAFYVDVGDLPPREAMAFVNKVRQQFKKRKFINPSTGKMDLKWNSLAQDEDFFVPVRKGTESTRIEVLGSPSWQHMDDVEYFRDKMFAAIKVPKAYLGQEEGVARAVLSSEDTRFARTILRVQKELRSGFSKVMRVHMAALGIDPTRAEFEIHMTTPSSIFELAQLEVRNARADLATRMREHVSLHWVLSNVFQMGDSEIKTILQQREEDTIRDMEAEGKGQAAAQKQMPKEDDPFGAPGGAPGAPKSPEPPSGEMTPAAAEGPQSAESIRRFRSHFLQETQRRVEARRHRWTERELFAGNRESEKRAEDKINRLLENDRVLSGRLGEIRSLVRELAQTSRK